MASVSCGVPVTVTASVKLICRLIVDPSEYVPSGVDEVTDVTEGTTPSITRFLFAPSEPAAPGDGSVPAPSGNPWPPPAFDEPDRTLWVNERGATEIGQGNHGNGRKRTLLKAPGSDGSLETDNCSGRWIIKIT